MRRKFGLLMTAAMLVAVTAPAAQAAPSAQGALKASFNAVLSGGNANWYATEFHAAQGLFHAANNSIYSEFFGVESAAARISPIPEEQFHCASKTFGIWAVLWDTDKAELKNAVFDIWFDGELLDSTSSAVKRAVDPHGVWFDGETTWWMSTGVPVYGTLAPGDYDIYSEYTIGAEEGAFEGVVHVLPDC